MYISEYKNIKKKIDDSLLREAFRRTIDKEEFVFVCKKICQRHKLSFRNGQFNISSLKKRCEGGVIVNKKKKLIPYVFIRPDELNFGTLLHEFTHVILFMKGYLNANHNELFIETYTKLLTNFSNGLY